MSISVIPYDLSAPRFHLAAAAASCAMLAAPAHAAPVEYVKICSLYGAGFFYIPGTDTCVNANQILQNEYDIARRAPAAPPAPRCRLHWLRRGCRPARTTPSRTTGRFRRPARVRNVGLVRISGNLVFSAGVAVGLDQGDWALLTNRTATEFGVAVLAQSGATCAASAARASCTRGDAPAARSTIPSFSKDRSMTLSISHHAAPAGSCRCRHRASTTTSRSPPICR